MTSLWTVLRQLAALVPVPAPEPPEAARAFPLLAGPSAWVRGVPTGALLLLASASAAPGEPPTQISGAVYLGDAPTVIADRRDLFAEHGLNAEVAYAPTGKRNLERLRAGELEFALMALTPLALDLLADATPGQPDDPVILASLAHAVHLSGVIAPADGPIRELGDLHGRRLGLARGSGAEFLWWLTQRIHGLDQSAVDLVNLPADALPGAIAHGSVGAALMWSPWRERLQAQPDMEVRTLSDGAGYTAKWVIVTRRTVAEGEPARCRALLAAYGDAIGFIRRQSTDARRLYAEHAEVPAELLERSWNPMVYGLALDWSTISALQQQLDWARRTRDVHAIERPSVLPLFAPGPLRALAPGAVGIPRLDDEGP